MLDVVNLLRCTRQFPGSRGPTEAKDVRFAGFSHRSTCRHAVIRIRRVHSSDGYFARVPTFPCAQTLFFPPSILDNSHGILVSHTLGDVKLF